MKTKKLILTVISGLGLFLIALGLTQCNTKKREIATIGSQVPNIEIVDVAGSRKISSSQLKGKVLFINFWASWCNPCQEEMPSIERLFRHFINKSNFIVLTILYKDDPNNGIYYLKRNGFNFPLTIDKDENAADAYGVTGVPETYIVDKKGVLRKKIIGPYEWDSPVVITFISDLLDE